MKMAIFIEKKCLFKPLSYETCCRLSAINEIWYVHLSSFLNNTFQKSDHLSPPGKISPPVHPLHQIFIASTKGQPLTLFEKPWAIFNVTLTKMTLTHFVSK